MPPCQASPAQPGPGPAQRCCHFAAAGLLTVAWREYGQQVAHQRSSGISSPKGRRFQTDSEWVPLLGTRFQEPRFLERKSPEEFILGNSETV